MNKKWINRFMEVVDVVATWSKDRSTKCGCVIIGKNNEILSTGYNSFPRGVDDNIDLRHQRPVKYLYTEHAERNAIYNAARNGVKLEGTIMILKWYPCANCARAIIQSGIKKIYCEKPGDSEKDQRWKDEFRVSSTIFDEAGVEVNFIEEL